jgi:DNA-binding MarR family transcriptional regulator
MQRKSDRLAASNDEDISLGRLGEFIGFRLRRIQNHLSSEFAPESGRSGLRPGEFSALAIISANPGLSQVMLSREVGLDKSATVMVIDDLEKQGLAERRRSPVDRRRHALYTTERGEAALAGMFDKLETVERDVLTALEPDDLHLLNAFLDRIYKTAFRG